MAEIARCPKLGQLTLGFPSLTDGGIKHLRVAASLRKRFVAKSQVTAEGVKDLAATLPKCRIEWDGGVIEPKAPTP